MDWTTASECETARADIPDLLCGVKLGVDKDDRYVASHPVTVDSVMSYDSRAGVNEPDCAPHPLDIMAIFSLYQSP